MIDLTKLDDNQITAEINKIKNKRGEIEKELHNLEKQIYNLETSYLQDTHHIGNLVKGWSGYLSSRAPQSTKKVRLKDSDRIFSLSSVDAIENIEADSKRDRKRIRKKFHPYKIQKSSRGNSRRSIRGDEGDVNF
mmetsp:Transcript_23429/g.40053  ORF Transcript_23429/g.40053 Transcript_23429/m.40053 type:complete len:135 (+) Transcript_23429:3-407(+)